MFSFFERMSSLIDRNDIEMFCCNIAETALYYGIDQLRNDIWARNENTDDRIISSANLIMTGLLCLPYAAVSIYHYYKISKTIPDNASKVRHLMTHALTSGMLYLSYNQLTQKNFSQNSKHLLAVFSFLYGSMSCYNVGTNFFSKMKNCIYSFKSNPLETGLATIFHIVNLKLNLDYVYMTALGDNAFLKNPNQSKIKVLTSNRFNPKIHSGLVLNVSSTMDSDAACQAIKRNFRKISLEIHPDKNPRLLADMSHEAFVMLKEAKDVLMRKHSCNFETVPRSIG